MAKNIVDFFPKSRGTLHFVENLDLVQPFIQLSVYDNKLTFVPDVFVIHDKMMHNNDLPDPVSS